MTKYDQLQRIKALGIPTPKFDSMPADPPGNLPDGIKYPVAVRSSYASEDQQAQSMAGQLISCLEVEEEEFPSAFKRVVEAYPKTDNQRVIVQEMLEPSHAGVLFAWRNHPWKVEFAEGLGTHVAGGLSQPESLLLPRFGRQDVFWSGLWSFWKPWGQDKQREKLVRPFIRLSFFAQQLLKDYGDEASLGLDIEFAISKGRMYVLQARPITTAEEAEEVLTSANHKETLPGHPSAMMTSIIESASPHLYTYYRKLDPSLPQRNFIEVSNDMPWINLTALLDAMAAWGLPTALVIDLVGGVDIYQIGFRPYRSIRKWRVFANVLREQMQVVGRTRRWVRATRKALNAEIDTRRMMWRNHPDLAFNNWLTNVQTLYVDLVTLTQALTGAMSGPIRWMSRMGLLHHLSESSESTKYLAALSQVFAGNLDRDDFLKQYGHRGFFESDIGQKRFAEYNDLDWAAMGQLVLPEKPAIEEPKRNWSGLDLILKPYMRMLYTREWLKNHAMRYFFQLREEILEQTQGRFGDKFDFSLYSPADLAKMLEEGPSPDEIPAPAPSRQTGWDLDAFLRNRNDRRIHVSHLSNVQAGTTGREDRGIGIYPGQVRGRIWKVEQHDLGSIPKPDFERTILLTETLDPAWIPMFVQVDGVLSRVGGILSHASIVLRESRIPAITQLPGDIQLQTGDEVEFDGRTGEVKILARAEQAD
ncbi:PEP-utilizing enzyme [Pontibacter sp. G13]|uniref:PEP-utilizing enzyme n=1 Tax=Pontibacter sp. G13 TaxID=3074898 RepID=UPI00288AC451|nr:PEP-utilizing enzyme [Pontibacter sp. G13]WNJ21168.1 PEP-utilizing enzyme [Pontibacter sp. G13]